jgi:hypothetical protein
MRDDYDIASESERSGGSKHLNAFFSRVELSLIEWRIRGSKSPLN